MKLFNSVRSNLTTENIMKFLKQCKGFDKVVNKAKVLEIGNGKCVAELKVEEEHTNPIQTLHGGLASTLVDGFTSYALLTHEKCAGIPSVSVDIHMTFLKAAVIGDEIIIDAKTIRTGKTLAFLECEIKNKATGELLAKGAHTKFLIQSK